jgi:hypothetical protein
VIAVVAEHEFARSDFPQAGLHVFRLSRDVTQLMLHSVSLSAYEIEEAAEWMMRTIWRYSAAKRRFMTTVFPCNGKNRVVSGRAETNYNPKYALMA